MAVCSKCQKPTDEKPDEIKFCQVMYWNTCKSCELIETFRTCSKCREPLCIICEIDGQHECSEVNLNE